MVSCKIFATFTCNTIQFTLNLSCCCSWWWCLLLPLMCAWRWCSVHFYSLLFRQCSLLLLLTSLCQVDTLFDARERQKWNTWKGSFILSKRILQSIAQPLHFSVFLFFSFSLSPATGGHECNFIEYTFHPALPLCHHQSASECEYAKGESFTLHKSSNLI